MTRAGSIKQNNRQNRKSQNQPSNVPKFSKTLFSHCSLYTLQRISKLIARNSYLALKEAITSQCDVTSIILTRTKIETFKESFVYRRKIKTRSLQEGFFLV